MISCARYEERGVVTGLWLQAQGRGVVAGTGKGRGYKHRGGVWLQAQGRVWLQAQGRGVVTGTGEGVVTGTGEGVVTGTGEGVVTSTGEGCGYKHRGGCGYRHRGGMWLLAVTPSTQGEVGRCIALDSSQLSVICRRPISS